MSAGNAKALAATWRDRAASIRATATDAARVGIYDSVTSSFAHAAQLEECANELEQALGVDLDHLPDEMEGRRLTGRDL